ncbi:MAG: ABC transporter substrate-binding protein, partial [Betaproteobacteria bacterium]
MASASLLSFPAAHAADDIKLGLLEDQSGNFAIAVIPKIYAYQLAVDEINAKGGVLGRKLKITHY